MAEFYQERGFSVNTTAFDAALFQPATLADLIGGDRAANALIVRRILNGEERGPKRDAVLLNAGAALFVAGKARTITEGWEMAAELIDSGQAHRKLEALTASA
jgi:anthranilate phosphoribosyltransferase